MFVRTVGQTVRFFSLPVGSQISCFPPTNFTLRQAVYVDSFCWVAAESQTTDDGSPLWLHKVKQCQTFNTKRVSRLPDFLTRFWLLSSSFLTSFCCWPSLCTFPPCSGDLPLLLGSPQTSASLWRNWIAVTTAPSVSPKAWHPTTPRPRTPLRIPPGNHAIGAKCNGKSQRWTVLSPNQR